MDLRDIKNKMNVNVEIGLKQDSPMFLLSKQYNFSGAAAAVKSGDDMFIKVFMPKGERNDNVKHLFPLLDVEERKDYYIVTERLNKNITDLINRVNHIAGTKISDFSLNKDLFVVSLSLHESAKYRISSVIHNNIINDYLINDLKIYNNDLLNVLKDRNNRDSLSVISLGIDPELFRNDKLINILNNHESIAELIDNYPENNKFRVLIYSKDKINGDNIDTVSSMDGIYETRIENDLFNELSNRANSMYIFRDYVFIKLVNNKPVITLIMPEFRSMEFLKLAYSTITELGYEKQISLEKFDKYSDELSGDIWS